MGATGIRKTQLPNHRSHRSAVLHDRLEKLLGMLHPRHIGADDRGRTCTGFLPYPPQGYVSTLVSPRRHGGQERIRTSTSFRPAGSEPAAAAVTPPDHGSPRRESNPQLVLRPALFKSAASSVSPLGDVFQNAWDGPRRTSRSCRPEKRSRFVRAVARCCRS